MSYLLEALRTHQPLPADHSAALAHYSRQAELAAQMLAKPSRTFDSEVRGARVRCVYELDTEPMQYQFGAIAVDLELLEVWIGGWEASEHLKKSSGECLHGELMRELGL